MRHILPLFAAISLLATQALCAGPRELPSPTGEIVLTVTGIDPAINGRSEVFFDRDMLEELGTRTLETTTIWTEGPQKFEGVTLAALLDFLCVTGGTIRASAINDYSIEIPFETISEEAPILAMRRNERNMTVRQKGPLWIIYPYDSHPDYRTEVVYSRSIWQLDRIEVIR